jgi:hypothetical protein
LPIFFFFFGTSSGGAPGLDSIASVPLLPQGFGSVRALISYSSFFRSRVERRSAMHVPARSDFAAQARDLGADFSVWSREPMRRPGACALGFRFKSSCSIFGPRSGMSSCFRTGPVSSLDFPCQS